MKRRGYREPLQRFDAHGDCSCHRPMEKHVVVRTSEGSRVEEGGDPRDSAPSSTTINARSRALHCRRHRKNLCRLIYRVPPAISIEDTRRILFDRFSRHGYHGHSFSLRAEAKNDIVAPRFSDTSTLDCTSSKVFFFNTPTYLSNRRSSCIDSSRSKFKTDRPTQDQEASDKDRATADIRS